MTNKIGGVHGTDLSDQFDIVSSLMTNLIHPGHFHNSIDNQPFSKYDQSCICYYN